MSTFNKVKEHVNDPESDGLWGEDSEFNRDEWAQDVRDGDTELGYWDWVSRRRKFYKKNPQYKHYWH